MAMAFDTCKTSREGIKSTIASASKSRDQRFKSNVINMCNYNWHAFHGDPDVLYLSNVS
jgi:hypothetical protein